jgi:HEAT repeat protein
VKLVHHKSAYVRQEVLKTVLKQGHVPIKEIFSLIDDRDESIRRLMLKHLGQSRDRTAEDLLLRYLESGKPTNADSGHVIACYTALGQCGSSKSLPFLRQTLLGSGWFPSFGVSVHREGAAVALSKMRTKEAQQILEKAGRSLSPGLRRIVRKVK